MAIDWGKFGTNPFKDWLEPGIPGSVPEAGYYAYANQFGQGQNQKNWAENQFANVQKRYQGAAGQQILAGQAPTLNFADFLSQYFAPNGGMQQQWAGMSPSARGEQQARFAPPVRWMTNGRNSGFGGF